MQKPFRFCCRSRLHTHLEQMLSRKPRGSLTGGCLLHAQFRCKQNALRLYPPPLTTAINMLSQYKHLKTP